MRRKVSEISKFHISASTSHSNVDDVLSLRLKMNSLFTDVSMVTVKMGLGRSVSLCILSPS